MPNALLDYATLPFPLTPVEAEDLHDYEATIQRGLNTFYDVAAAFVSIKQRKLYRVEYSTFEEYCREKWHVDRSYADRMIEAAEVRQNLVPIGTVLPEKESHARALIGLTPEQQRQVWPKAVETAPNGKVTAKHIRDVRQVEIPLPKPEPSPVAAAAPDKISVFIPADDESLTNCPLCDPPTTLKYKTYGRCGVYCPKCLKEWTSADVVGEPGTVPDFDVTEYDDAPADREPEADDIGSEQPFAWQTQDREKICNAGLRIFRAAWGDPREKRFELRELLPPKHSHGSSRSWQVVEQFESKAAVKRRIQELDQDQHIIFESRI